MKPRKGAFSEKSWFEGTQARSTFYLPFPHIL